MLQIKQDSNRTVVNRNDSWAIIMFFLFSTGVSTLWRHVCFLTSSFPSDQWACFENTRRETWCCGHEIDLHNNNQLMPFERYTFLCRTILLCCIGTRLRVACWLYTFFVRNLVEALVSKVSYFYPKIACFFSSTSFLFSFLILQCDGMCRLQ